MAERGGYVEATPTAPPPNAQGGPSEPPCPHTGCGLLDQPRHLLLALGLPLLSRGLSDQADPAVIETDADTVSITCTSAVVGVRCSRVQVISEPL